MGIGIIGYGVVGKAMHKMFPHAVIYDEPLGLFLDEGHGKDSIKAVLSVDPEITKKRFEINNLKERGREAISECEIAFLCVPTPNLPDGSLDTSIIDEVMFWCESRIVCIRSAVNPGTCDNLEKMGHRIVYQPEYIGEGVAPPLLDEAKTPFMILGGKPENRKKVIEAYQEVYNANVKIRQTTNLEAEIIKLSENRAILYKVAQCQELYDACEAAGVDYYTVRDAVYGDDPRFNLWFSFVYPERRGANSKCIPKDIRAWSAWAGKPELTEAVLKYNEGLINGVDSNTK